MGALANCMNVNPRRSPEALQLVSDPSGGARAGQGACSLVSAGPRVPSQLQVP